MSDLDRLARLPMARDVTFGLANSMCALVGDKDKHAPTRKTAIAHMGEVADRYAALVVTLAGALATYDPAMTEVQLRAWAAEMMEGLRQT